MTCAGGGAVAFPVMTLAFNVKPSIARDVSLMIQSSGMTAASFTIFFMRVKIEVITLGCCFVSAIGGVIFGLHVIDPLMPPDVKKMAFVSLWFAFAFVLFLLNRNPNRKVYDKIPDMKPWKIGVLILVGFIGGTFSAWAGSGLDLCVFSVVTTLFRVSEKIATPTSVILMGTNSVICVFWRAIVLEQVETEAWEFIGVTFPIVTIGAPLGSLLGTHFHREVLAASLYIVTTAALIGAYFIVPQTLTLYILSPCVMIGSCTIFGLLAYAGKRLLESIHDDPDDYETKKTMIDEKKSTKKDTNGNLS